MIRNNQRRRRGGGNNGPRPQQMAGGGNYGNRLDNRQRGNATQLLEKYRALARDAQQAGDRVTAEYYLQYAEHYFRVLGDYRERQPDNRRGQNGFDDDMGDGEDGGDDTIDASDSDDREERDDQRRDPRARDDRSRDDRPRDDRPRDDRGRDDRGRDRNRDERPRDDRPRDDRSREQRPREDRPREDRPREDRPREERAREERPRDDRPRDDNNRRDWQRDRRERRADAPRNPTGSETADTGEDRESLLQALPPAVSREPAAGEGRRLSTRRSAVTEDAAPPVESVAPVAEAEGEAAPRRRGRPRKVVEAAGE